MKRQSPSIFEDHQCAICMTAYYIPVTIIPCKHIFCQSCLEDSSQITGKRKCPLCRLTYTPKQVQRNQKLQEQVQKLYPNQINDKKKRIKHKKVLHLKIGNTTRQIPDTQANGNKYQWKLFVKSDDGQKPLKQYASRVQLQLHPTFHPNRLIYDLNKVQNIQLKRIGWGTFRIGIKIFWRNDIYEQQHHEVFHDLDFIPLKENIVVCHLHEKAKQ